MIGAVIITWLAAGCVVALVLGRKWAAVRWPVVVLAWPWFLKETLET